MRILIITTFFSPDTAIAAVRPHMFAKYLALKGHDVTVIRSGEILAFVDDSYDCERFGVRVISYLGSESMAEQYKRGALKRQEIDRPKSRIAFLPVKTRKRISDIYHSLMRSVTYASELKQARVYSRPLRRAIDSVAHEKFDIVFSTYGRLENVFAGKYAKNTLSCVWILDLRDRIAHEWDFLIRRLQQRIEKKYIALSDACTAISSAYCDDIVTMLPGVNVTVLYNGYEEVDSEQPASEREESGGLLRFCYTGSLYTGKLDVSPLFRALGRLAAEGSVDLARVRFDYAGAEFEYLSAQAARYKVDGILMDRGYLGREKVRALQADSDIFVVAARNTKYCFGELTGKFYEGIRACKPILTIITGDMSHSELGKMQEKYSYGHCYEQAGDPDASTALCAYLREAYERRMRCETVRYAPQAALFHDFRYDVLADRLEQLMDDLARRGTRKGA